ncbi:MAG: PPOX class F420-dependent oxidoreductase [Myxococcota bacterium]|jgi:PPOX class probable F420-dependent enzyme|nr:PPOX class F420-dependent oxidoreductase [Myxococcota bacterium]
MTEKKEVAIPEAHHELLREQHFGFLTTLRPDGMLSTNPVGFLFDGERVRISTLGNRFKVRNLRADPRVAFCVQSASNPMDYIEIRGKATIADDPDRSFFRAQFMDGAGSEPPDDIDPPDAERVIITLHPQRVSAPQLYGGRFDT